MGLANSFTLQLKNFSEKAQARADDVVGLIIVKVAKELDDRSPVGDASYWKHKPPKGYVGGRFRGNWQLGINVEPSGETGIIDPKGAEAAYGNIVASVPAQPAGTVAFLVNNVPYAERIEDGWSRQAPQGLVSLTVTKFRTFVEEAVAEAKP